MYVKQLPSGTWRVIVQHAGRKATGTAETYSEAQILGGQLLEQLGRVADDSTPLGEYLVGYVEHLEIAATTRADYTAILVRLNESKHELLSAPIAKVTTARLVALYRDMRHAGWSAHRTMRLHTVISGAFAQALRLDLVQRNPARGATPAAPRKPAIKVPTNDDVRRILDAAGDFAPVLTLLAATGMRRGELVGLRWCDIDFDAGSVALRRAVAHTPASGTVIKELKNDSKGERVIALDSTTLAMLKQMRRDIIALTLEVGSTFSDDQFIFSTRAGGPRRPDYITKRYIKIRTELGLDHVRLYDLRHWMVTTLLSAGHPPAVVAGRAGHDVRTMVDRYWHFIPASDRTEADFLGGILRSVAE
jgi:integrase